VRILIKDDMLKPLVYAKVRLGGSSYLTDGSGMVSAKLARGVYNLKIEKPGYETNEFSFRIQNRIYNPEKLPWSIALPAAAALACVFLIYRRFFRRKKTHRGL
jgi:uncharacterized membrane protein